MLFQIVFILFSIPLSAFIEKYGSAKSLLLGAFLNAAGMGVKCLINQSFWIYFVAQFLPALAACLIINVPGKLS